MKPLPPLDPGELFWICTRIGLSGFGGVLPLLRRMTVEEKQLMQSKEFNALLGLCQFFPGSNVVNLVVCMGGRLHGPKGALAAAAGILCGPFLLMMALATLYGFWGHLPLIQDMLRGVAAAGSGLLFATALKMARSVREPWIYLPFSLTILLCLVLLRWPLAPLMLGLLAATGGLAYYRGRQRRAGGSP